MRLTAAKQLFIHIIIVFAQWESPAWTGQGTSPPVAVCGWFWLCSPSSHQTVIKPVCIPLRLPINICGVLSEPVWGCQWETQLWRCDSWAHCLPRTSFSVEILFFSTLKHSHSAERTRGGSAHTAVTQVIVKSKWLLFCPSLKMHKASHW